MEVLFFYRLTQNIKKFSFKYYNEQLLTAKSNINELKDITQTELNLKMRLEIALIIELTDSY